MSAFPRVTRWRIPKDVWRGSLAEMALDGGRGDEGIALWLGRRVEGVGEVTRAVFLRGPGVVKHPAFLQIDVGLMNDVTAVAVEHEAALIGQIHSHGLGYSTDLSPTDRAYGIAVPDYLSLVAPDYAMRPETLPAACGVHVFRPRSGFVRLSAADASRRVELSDRPSPAPLIVGG